MPELFNKTIAYLSMEQESDKIVKKTQKEDQVSSVNPQGGVHQEGGGSSSGPIQGGEQQDIQMTNKRNSKSEYKRMGESNADVNMKVSGKRQR